MDTKNKAEGTATVVASLSDISLYAPHTRKGAMNSATTSGPVKIRSELIREDRCYQSLSEFISRNLGRVRLLTVKDVQRIYIGQNQTESDKIRCFRVAVSMERVARVTMMSVLHVYYTLTKEHVFVSTEPI